MHTDTSRILGNILIGIACIGMVIGLYPLIASYVQYYVGDDPGLSEHVAFSISLPNIKAAAEVIPEVDPWDARVYQEALLHGVAHAAGSPLPGQSGTVYLFAHSSDDPFSLLRSNPAFFRLHMLEVGDVIRISYNDELYSYTVRELRTVSPTEVSYLTESDRDQLVLQTCAPIGTDWNRLLVFADPV